MNHSFGAKKSIVDYRTIVADKVTSVLPPLHAKVSLDAPKTNELCNQRKLGVCTSCTVRMMAESHFKDGVRLSEYWLYLMQETLIDPVDSLFIEGSAIFFGLKVAHKYGVPEKTMESSYPLKIDGSYQEFINHFKTTYGGKVPQAVLDNASKHKIAGYNQVPVNPVSLAKEIAEGRLLGVRFAVGENTYTPSWKPQDLFPLRPPKNIEGGHAWCMNEYSGLDENQEGILVNSWSELWGNKGYGNFIFKTQKPYFTEAWSIISPSPKVIEEIKKLPVPAYPAWYVKFLSLLKLNNVRYDNKLKAWVYIK